MPPHLTGWPPVGGGEREADRYRPCRASGRGALPTGKLAIEYEAVRLSTVSPQSLAFGRERGREAEQRLPSHWYWLVGESGAEGPSNRT